MKKILSALIIVVFNFSTARAQTRPDTIDFKKHLGKTGTLCDYVSSIKFFGDTLTLLSMGGMHPNEKFIVAIKGNRIQLDWGNLKGKHVCVTGVLELYKEQLAIVALEPRQVVVDKP